MKTVTHPTARFIIGLVIAVALIYGVCVAGMFDQDEIEFLPALFRIGVVGLIEWVGIKLLGE